MEKKEGKKFNKFLKRLGWSKNKLSKELACSRILLQYWARGDRSPSFKMCDKLKKIAEDNGFSVTYEELRD